MINQVLFYVGLISFLLFLTITLFLFFYLRIIETIGTLSGMTAKRNIKKIHDMGQKDRQAGRRPEVRSYEASGEIKAKRGRTTAKLILESREAVQNQETTLLQEGFQGQDTTLLESGQIQSFQKIIDIVIVHSQERI